MRTLTLLVCLSVSSAFAQLPRLGGGGGGGASATLAAPVVRTVTAQTGVSILAADHGLGANVGAYCLDSSNNFSWCAFSKATNGDLVFAFNPAFTGYIVVVQGAVTAGQGPSGSNGSNGNGLLNGTGAPSAGTGINGDFYIDTTTPPGTIYGPKSGGAWGSGTSMGGGGGASSANQLNDWKLTRNSSTQVTIAPPTNGVRCGYLTKFPTLTVTIALGAGSAASGARLYPRYSCASSAVVIDSSSAITQANVTLTNASWGGSTATGFTLNDDLPLYAVAAGSTADTFDTPAFSASTGDYRSPYYVPNFAAGTYITKTTNPTTGQVTFDVAAGKIPASCNTPSGAGSPNGSVTGNVCDRYLDTSGGASATLYVKESGTGTNTGWVSATTAMVNVKAYGAKGNGSTLDDAAIASAITACQAMGVTYLGCEVYFPPGNYRISQPILLVRNGVTPLTVVTLRGAGWRVSTITPTAALAAGRSAIEWGTTCVSGNCQAWHQSIRDLQIDLSSVTNTGGYGIHYGLINPIANGITSVTGVSGGSGCSASGAVTATGYESNGSGFTGTYAASGGVLTSVSVTTAGTGYWLPVTLAFAGCGGTPAYTVVGPATQAQVQNEWIQLDLDNVLIDGNNQTNPACVYVEGGWRISNVRSVTCDPQRGTSGTPTYSNTWAIKTDENDFGGNGTLGGVGLDSSGFEYGVMTNVQADIRRGGWSGVFSGRMLSSQFLTGFSNGPLQGPNVWFNNSVEGTIDNLVSEGNGQPIISVNNSNAMKFRNIALGAPHGSIYSITGVSGGTGCAASGTISFTGGGTGASGTYTGSAGAVTSATVTNIGTSGYHAGVTATFSTCSVQPSYTILISDGNGIEFHNTWNSEINGSQQPAQNSSQYSSYGTKYITLDSNSHRNRFLSMMIPGPLSTEATWADPCTNFIESYNTIAGSPFSAYYHETLGVSPFGWGDDPLNFCVVSWKDEMLAVNSSSTTSGNVGQLGWKFSSVGAAPVISYANTYPYLGYATVTTTSTSGQGGWLYNDAVGYSNWPAQVWDLEEVFALNTTATVQFRLGVANSGATTAIPTNGFYLRYDTTLGDTQFMICSDNTSAETCSTTGVNVDTNKHRLSIRTTGSSKVGLTLRDASGVSQGNGEINICSGCTINVAPAGNTLAPALGIVTATTATASASIDLAAFKGTATR